MVFALGSKEKSALIHVAEEAQVVLVSFGGGLVHAGVLWPSEWPRILQMRVSCSPKSLADRTGKSGTAIETDFYIKAPVFFGNFYLFNLPGKNDAKGCGKQ